VLVMGPPVAHFAREGRWEFPAEVLAAYRRENLLIEIMFPITWGGTWDYPYPEAQALIRQMRELFGAAKLVWGSDMPNVERFCTYRQSLDYVRRLPSEHRLVCCIAFASFSVVAGPPSPGSASNVLIGLGLLSALTAWSRKYPRAAPLILWAGGLVLLTKGERFRQECALLAIPLLASCPPFDEGAAARLCPQPVRAAALAAALAMPFFSLKKVLGGGPRYPLSLRNLPQGDAAFLGRLDLEGTLLNDPSKGGYWEWALKPGWRIAMDLQTPFLFGDNDLYLFMNAFSDDKLLSRVLADYHPDFIAAPLARSRFPELVGLHPQYVPVFFDDVEALYVDGRRHPEIAGAYKLPVDPFHLPAPKPSPGRRGGCGLPAYLERMLAIAAAPRGASGARNRLGARGRGERDVAHIPGARRRPPEPGRAPPGPRGPAPSRPGHAARLLARGGGGRERPRPRRAPLMRRADLWVGALLAAAFAAMAAWTWGRWMDVLVDFGHEVCASWQLSEGKAFYSEIRLLNGPLSAHLNAFWFRLLGVSIRSLVLANLALLACLTALLYSFFRDACGRATGAAAGLVFLLVFAFSQYVGTGNYNYVCPYSHEAVHDVAAAAAAASAAAWALALSARGGTRSALRACGLYLAAAAAPPLLFLLFLIGRLSLFDALRAVAGGWAYLAKTGVGTGPFFRHGMGLDKPLENALAMCAVTARIVLFVWAAACCETYAQPLKGWPRKAAALACGGVMALAALAFDWSEAGRALPPLSVFLTAWLLLRARREPAARRDALALWGVFSVALLGRMWLNGRIAHYGFYQAMPAALLVVAFLIDRLPRELGWNGRQGVLFRGLLLTALGIGVVRHLAYTDRWNRLKVYPVGSGADQILTYPPEQDPRGAVVNQTLQWLEANTAPDATVVTLPEGSILNYLSRRRNPSPYPDFMPSTVEALGGEGEVLRGLQARPPDYFLLANVAPRGYGVPLFGQDAAYGRRILSWVRSAYAREALFGEEPFVKEGNFGIEILKRL
jgi:hypothetical protein